MKLSLPDLAKQANGQPCNITSEYMCMFQVGLAWTVGMAPNHVRQDIGLESTSIVKYCEGER